MVATNGNTSAVGVRFFGVDKADHFGIDNLLVAFMRDVLVADDLECIGALDTLTFVGGVVTNV